MGKNGRDLLEEVQSLDDGAKRKVLIVSSAVVIVIVVAIWVLYFNDIVMAPSGENGQVASTTAAVPVPSVSAANPSSSGPGFWHTVGNDLSGLANVFTGGHEYIQSSH